MLLTHDMPAARTIDPAFRRDILAGLARSPKATPPIWFYDRRGSELFEDITDLPEYYPTRTETALLAGHGGDFAAAIGSGRAVVEFGAGSARKTPHLLRAIDPAAYVPIDISGDFLRTSSAELASAFPGLPVLPLVGDFTGTLALPDAIDGLPRLGFFPGSTIGNSEPDTAVDLLRAMRRLLGDAAMLLIGMDRIKDRDRLIAAYDDEAGVTAAFNRNLLVRINRELEGDLPVDAFAHRAIWNDEKARIEMHLEATEPLHFHVAGQCFHMKAGETIHTESSHKYGARDERLLLRAGGWEPTAEWMDPDGLFALVLAKAG
ncbi:MULTISPECIES: L-histidine N(alpha)-methyltransferase [Sphingobium]|jgi:dimethylhistidine N-methyltransferase|uniref:L-histidine N(Alpha)-methyltransferase n=1 Tax=Sphingobium yanoikuyae TaxID=13690 RepID=A0A0J9D691_SPHYA|nr:MULTISPECIES: L-histidine N(alpha)-methyltransferase [Sphingobium]ATP16931.1 L-histidine N(alpha)-methyltransferase [Sphingobium yanoikuyae]KMW33027.1 methyltransferase [Sphingobium yanoikuyae]QHD70061.1 L-histidine N(alpha)-methyltransferase [Sphingobium yanoikuyae]TKV42292.1 dimethylhistidine N-methyltransferase [Sphingobium sp. MP9-4]